jgi:hypothetical protein
MSGLVRYFSVGGYRVAAIVDFDRHGVGDPVTLWKPVPDGGLTALEMNEYQSKMNAVMATAKAEQKALKVQP